MEFAQRQAQQVAFAAGRLEARGLGGIRAGFDRTQRLPERERIVGLDGGETFAAKRPARIGSARSMVWRKPAMSWRGFARRITRMEAAP